MTPREAAQAGADYLVIGRPHYAESQSAAGSSQHQSRDSIVLNSAGNVRLARCPWLSWAPDSNPPLSPGWRSSTDPNGHIFIDYRIIWTVEVAEEFKQAPVPIVNIITFEAKEAPLRPQQIHLYNATGRTAEVKKFAIETGFEPYITNYLRVLSSSFIGFDLEGDFEGFSEPERVVIELGETEFKLQAVDCLDYGMLAGQINKVNYDSPEYQG